MKQLVTSIVIILLGTSIYGQSEKIDAICNQYDDQIRYAVEEEAPEALPQMKITCQLNKRAIGLVNHLITIYFDEHETEMETEDDMIFLKEAVIRKAEFQISAVSYNLNFSYYFDEGGVLIKYIEKSEGYDCLIKQVYFNDKGAFRIKQDKLESELCISEEQTEVYDHQTLTKEEKAQTSWLLQDGGKFRQLLFNNYEFFKD